MALLLAVIGVVDYRDSFNGCCLKRGVGLIYSYPIENDKDSVRIQADSVGETIISNIFQTK